MSKIIQDEFQEFDQLCQCQSAIVQNRNSAPRDFERLHSLVRNELSPGLSKSFRKLVLIHIFATALSVMICPQFGIGWGGGIRV